MVASILIKRMLRETQEEIARLRQVEAALSALDRDPVARQRVVSIDKEVDKAYQKSASGLVACSD